MARRTLPRIVSLIYTQNPFYLISTCLFVYGLKILFRTGDTAVLFEKGSVAYMEPWGLVSSFAAVTLLMAVTAVLVVRFGKVWEDARSLVLIVLLMLLAIAVSCDELYTLLSDRDHSRKHLLYTLIAGPAFAVCVCEFLIRFLRLRLRSAFRLPLYGFLALFFLWPALLLRELTGFSLVETRCLIAIFPSVAAVITLTLIPGVRQGATSVTDNGTPWRWPLYPWTPFLFIAVAVCLRSWFLSFSFDAMKLRGHYWDTIFGIYQLVPFLLAGLVLLLEIGRREKIGWLQHLVLLIAPLAVVAALPLSVPWAHLPTYRQFTLMISTEIASPVVMAMIGVACLYFRAWYLKVRHAEAALTGVFLMLCFADVHRFGLVRWETEFHPLLMVTLAACHVYLGLFRRASWNFTIGIAFGYFAAQHENWWIGAPPQYQSFINLHVLMMGVIVSGLAFRDGFGQFLRWVSPVVLWLTGIYGVLMLLHREAQTPALAVHLLTIAAVEFALYRALYQRGYLWAFLWQCTAATIGGLIVAAQLPSGSRQITFAVLSFAVAVFISALKSGLSRRIRFWWLTSQRPTV